MSRLPELLIRAARYNLRLYRQIDEQALYLFLNRMETNHGAWIRASFVTEMNQNTFNGEYLFKPIIGNDVPINMMNLHHFDNQILTFINFIIDWVKLARCGQYAKMSIRITDDEGRRNTSTPLIHKDSLTGELLLELIELLFQSDETMDFSKANFIVIWSNPRVGGTTPTIAMNRCEFVKKKRCIIGIIVYFIH